jgi:hypothetical protein
VISRQGTGISKSFFYGERSVYKLNHFTSGFFYHSHLDFEPGFSSIFSEFTKLLPADTKSIQNEVMLILSQSEKEYAYAELIELIQIGLSLHRFTAR